MHFDRFSTADRIVVTINSKAYGEPISDAVRIRAVTAFVLLHSEDWSVSVSGPPVARLNTQFYQGNRFLGDFGMGEEFASAQGCGYFQTRDLQSEDAAKFAHLLGVSEAEVGWK